MRQRAERAVRRGVAVAADDRRARQGEALLRPDDVHDALALVALGIILDAEFRRVLRDGLDLDAAFLLHDALGAIRGRDVVINHGESLLRRANLAVRHAQPFERLRRGDLVNEMTVDVEEARPVRLAIDHVIVENLVVQGLGRAHLVFS